MDADTHVVDPTNVSQAEAWDGPEGAFWAAHPAEFDRAVDDYHQPFMAAADVQVADRIVDIGCGNGKTTLDAAGLAPDGLAVGIDLSSAMINEARERAHLAGVDNVEFVAADAQVYPFEPAAYDVAISRSGAMFFGDRLAAFTNIARSLRPDGRLVLQSWQPASENGFALLMDSLAAGRTLPPPAMDAPGPFALADPDLGTEMLENAGFREIAFEPVTGSMWFGDSPDLAYDFVLGLLGWMLEGLSADQYDEATESLRTTLSAHAKDDGVRIKTGAWLVTARRC